MANPAEMRMGSPQYGRLLVGGLPLPEVGSVEVESLLWAPNGRTLAVQELVNWRDGPTTRVLLVDAKERAVVAASRAADGLCTPIRFEAGALLYSHWHHVGGTRELRLALPTQRRLLLCADTAKGNRPSFSAAARPELAEPLCERFCEALEAEGVRVARGVFGAHMEVELVNDGPVTIVLD